MHPDCLTGTTRHQAEVLQVSLILRWDAGGSLNRDSNILRFSLATQKRHETLAGAELWILIIKEVRVILRRLGRLGVRTELQSWVAWIVLLLRRRRWREWLLHVLGLRCILVHRSLVHHLCRATDLEWLVFLRRREDLPSMEVLALVSWRVLWYHGAHPANLDSV